MIDLAPEVRQALSNNSALAFLVGKDKSGEVKVYPEVTPDATALPYITFFELTNFNDKFVDNKAIDSEIHIQIDVWSKGSTSKMAQEVNRTMEDLGYHRSGTASPYDTETKTYHKVLRYKTNRKL
ncbi:hypothetical protein J2T13_000873 [Paenibacillus sp. DS2015]|uniref:DUF3168 domain-containing protein n=1 Tax=Paenibacillus sp. DS2015 TaxID=3373917 RepID=UPI003D2578AB